jgi:hypothetical protein
MKSMSLGLSPDHAIATPASAARPVATATASSAAAPHGACARCARISVPPFESLIALRRTRATALLFPLARDRIGSGARQRLGFVIECAEDGIGIRGYS